MTWLNLPPIDLNLVKMGVVRCARPVRHSCKYQKLIISGTFNPKVVRIIVSGPSPMPRRLYNLMLAETVVKTAFLIRNFSKNHSTWNGYGIEYNLPGTSWTRSLKNLRLLCIGKNLWMSRLYMSNGGRPSVMKWAITSPTPPAAPAPIYRERLIETAIGTVFS
jgi:hypothetical protein